MVASALATVAVTSARRNSRPARSKPVDGEHAGRPGEGRDATDPGQPVRPDRRDQRRADHPPAARRRVRRPQGRGGARGHDRPKLIDQAIKAQGVEVTPAEVDAEIERIAMSVAGVSREQWLATLAKERNISPAQYARDVIFPMIAMRKLAEPQVQVTEDDIKDGFEAKFGDQLRCRMIMFNDLRMAMTAWEELKKNPGLFEKLAQERSIDPSTAAVGGMLPQPITRHAYPRPVSDAAFEQLVDVDEGVDPKDPQLREVQAEGRRHQRDDPGQRGDLGHPEARGGHPRPALRHQRPGPARSCRRPSSTPSSRTRSRRSGKTSCDRPPSRTG